jgi:hypothetical protein
MFTGCVKVCQLVHAEWDQGGIVSGQFDRRNVYIESRLLKPAELVRIFVRIICCHASSEFFVGLFHCCGLLLLVIVGCCCYNIILCFFRK